MHLTDPGPDLLTRIPALTLDPSHHGDVTVIRLIMVMSSLAARLLAELGYCHGTCSVSMSLVSRVTALPALLLVVAASPPSLAEQPTPVAP